MKKYTSLDDFLADLTADKRLQVDALRELILATEPRLEEGIKWNAPNYVLNGEDRITFNLMNKQNLVKLVLHMGATRTEDKKGEPVMHDTSGLIEWNSNIRGTITFTSVEGITNNTKTLQKIICSWLVTI